ncbi:hypothetical protein EJ05DRAFT_45160 [Pseudovirgaria hyperparasitica]|uniref:Uncharacterized protein n=1 Tax=Pseudovirgaria hyperparasitica TaxID=470096 RepID=A0A6A6W479_9PEZI|nr:uncharacterized protein EJ05DRAFT_45160 [Pseudovirgaria hyperparasitica]KAF2756834.1 hypothetical protein EJ05DRAFT_45160 [Pseudovirgaria hyperparasitica]
MTRQIWDPYQTLNLNSHQDGEGVLCCVGRSVSRWNARCQYKIPDSDLVQIRIMINNMMAFSPCDSAIALSKLAKLCLCPSVHSNQKVEVVAKWKRKVYEEARNYEDSQRLRTENLRLIGKLAAERHEKSRLQEIVYSSSEPVHLALSDSSESTVSEIHEIDRHMFFRLSTPPGRLGHEQGLQQAEVDNENLKTRINQLEIAYAERARDAEELRTFLEYQKAEFNAELAQERESAREYQQVLQQGRAAVEDLQTSQDHLIEALQADIADKSVVLKKYESEMTEKAAKNLTLVNKIDRLTAQLDSESRNTKQLREDLEKVGNSEYSLVARISALEARLATELRKSEQLRQSLVTAHDAENEAVRQREHYHAQSLAYEASTNRLKKQIEAELQRRRELISEIETLRSLAQDNILGGSTRARARPRDERFSAAYTEDDNISLGRRDSVNSDAIEDLPQPLQFQKLSLGTAIGTDFRTETMLLEEIISLRQQLMNERDITYKLREEWDPIVARHESDMAGLKAKLVTQETINTKLEGILTMNDERGKERERKLRVQLESLQISLLQTQVELSNSSARNKFFASNQQRHLEQIIDLEAQLATKPAAVFGAKIGDFGRRIFGSLRSTWSNMIG